MNDSSKAFRKKKEKLSVTTIIKNYDFMYFFSIHIFIIIDIFSIFISLHEINYNYSLVLYKINLNCYCTLYKLIKLIKLLS